MPLINNLAIAAIAIINIMLSFNAFAGVELVCKGMSPQSSNKPIVVDCSDRQAVVQSLGSAWRTLRAQSIGGATENLCWEPFKRAEAIHPSISFTNIAPTFFAQCNMALQYIK